MEKNWYAVITADILYSDKINARQKLICAMVSNMSNDKGYCFASNRHFADAFNCDERTIQRDLKCLEDLNFLGRVIKVKPNGEIEFRALTPMTAMSPPHDIGVTTPHDTDVTIITNTINNKTNKDIRERKMEFYNSLPHSDYSEDIINEFFEYWTEHGEKDRKMRFEKQTSFNIKRRLSTWLKNEEKWKKEKGCAKKEKRDASDILLQQLGLDGKHN